MILVLRNFVFDHTVPWRFLGVALFFIATGGALCAEPTLQIDASQVTAHVSTTLDGLMTEELMLQLETQ